MDRGTRDGDRLRRPTAERKLSSGGGSKGLRMLTRQKAEPLLGMKLTLLRSGHRKGGASCRALDLETCRGEGGHVTQSACVRMRSASDVTHVDSSDTLTFSQPSGGSLLNM